MYSVALFVSKQSCGNLNSAVFITDANKGFLASSVVLWVFSVVLTIIGPVTMAVRKGEVCIHSLMFQMISIYSMNCSLLGMAAQGLHHSTCDRSFDLADCPHNVGSVWCCCGKSQQ